jgi:uncharacterized protein (DUF2062 family)
MVFKRRIPLTWWAFIREGFWPRAGWGRVIGYFKHRLRRLPDSPEKIGRGVFAGAFVSFLPIPGFQFIAGGLLAWAMRGNLLAALLTTFLSNPITTPVFAVLSIGLGHWMLGIRQPLNPEMIGHAFAGAGRELWHNFVSVFTPEVAHWDRLIEFWRTIYWPYFVGSLLPSVFVALVAYYLTVPLVRAYQAARRKQLQAKLARLRPPDPAPQAAPQAAPRPAPRPAPGKDTAPDPRDDDTTGG